MPEKTRVIVIDDDVTLANLLCMLFQKDGFEAISAPNGQEGLRLARKHKPEAIILDIMMPGMHGYEVCRRLRKADDLLFQVQMQTSTQDPNYRFYSG